MKFFNSVFAVSAILFGATALAQETGPIHALIGVPYTDLVVSSADRSKVYLAPENGGISKWTIPMVGETGEISNIGTGQDAIIDSQDFVGTLYDQDQEWKIRDAGNGTVHILAYGTDLAWTRFGYGVIVQEFSRDYNQVFTLTYV